MTTTTSGLSPAQLEALKKYDTPTICNTIELYKLRSRTQGYMDQRIKAVYPKLPPMVGYALTITFRSSCEGPKGDIYGTLDPQIRKFNELPGPAVIVVQDLDDPTAAATYGEIMCTTYQAFGAVGLITSGAGRDVEQVEALNFPCFVNSINPSHGYCHFESIGEPIEVGGTTVKTGDLLHGDANGVTTIPSEIASEVADSAAEFIRAETAVLDYFKGAQPATLEGYAGAKAEFKKIHSALCEKIAGR